MESDKGRKVYANFSLYLQNFLKLDGFSRKLTWEQKAKVGYLHPLSCREVCVRVETLVNHIDTIDQGRNRSVKYRVLIIFNCIP